MQYFIKTNNIESLKLMTEDSNPEPVSKEVCSMRVSKSVICFTIASIITGLVLVAYFSSMWTPRRVTIDDQDLTESSTFDEFHPHGNFPFDTNRDVFIPLYIQKTGVSNLVDHIIKDSDIQPRCEFQLRRRGQGTFFNCIAKDNSTWLVSRMTKVPRECGKYADWTALNQCTVTKLEDKNQMSRKRRYHYITMLRDPVKRFISEYLNFQAGEYRVIASICDGTQPKLGESVKLCYKNMSSEEVTLNLFMTCPVNHAVNRQTRMLADLRLVNCYNHSGITEEERDKVILESAKQNLRELSFFGLTEYQHLTKLVFEKTFNVRFLVDFRQFDATHADTAVISPDYLGKIATVNHNDVKFYQFAKSLFFQRVENMGIS